MKRSRSNSDEKTQDDILSRLTRATAVASESPPDSSPENAQIPWWKNDDEDSDEYPESPVLIDSHSMYTPKMPYFNPEQLYARGTSTEGDDNDQRETEPLTPESEVETQPVSEAPAETFNAQGFTGSQIAYIANKIGVPPEDLPAYMDALP